MWCISRQSQTERKERSGLEVPNGHDPKFPVKTRTCLNLGVTYLQRSQNPRLPVPVLPSLAVNEREAAAAGNVDDDDGDENVDENVYENIQAPTVRLGESKALLLQSYPRPNLGES